MKRTLVLLAIFACGPRVDPQGPGALPEIVEGPAAPEAPPPARLAPRPAPPVAPIAEVPAPAPSAPPAPTQASITLSPAKGSKVAGTILIVQGDDDTRLTGTITGLKKSTTYAFGKVDRCFAYKPDEDSKRSGGVGYFITVTSDAKGEAAISDGSAVIHLDGPQSLVGAIFIVAPSPSANALACGRVVAP